MKLLSNTTIHITEQHMKQTDVMVDTYIDYGVEYEKRDPKFKVCASGKALKYFCKVL